MELPTDLYEIKELRARVEAAERRAEAVQAIDDIRRFIERLDNKLSANEEEILDFCEHDVEGDEKILATVDKLFDEAESQISSLIFDANCHAAKKMTAADIEDMLAGFVKSEGRQQTGANTVTQTTWSDDVGGRVAYTDYDRNTGDYYLRFRSPYTVIDSKFVYRGGEVVRAAFPPSW